MVLILYRLYFTMNTPQHMHKKMCNNSSSMNNEERQSNINKHAERWKTTRRVNNCASAMRTKKEPLFLDRLILRLSYCGHSSVIMRCAVARRSSLCADGDHCSLSTPARKAGQLEPTHVDVGRTDPRHALHQAFICLGCSDWRPTLYYEQRCLLVPRLISPAIIAVRAAGYACTLQTLL